MNLRQLCQKCEEYPCVCVSGCIAVWNPDLQAYNWLFYGSEADELRRKHLERRGLK